MIDLDRAKAWIKKETADEDDLIGGLVNAAVATIEAQTGKFLSPRPFTQLVAGFPGVLPYAIKLSRGPVSEVGEIAYDPADGTAEATVADYRLVEGERAAVMPAFGESWPSTLDGGGTVRVTYIAGYDDGEADDLDQACLMLVAHWYQNREGGGDDIPKAVQALIGPYRPAGLA